MIRKYEDGYAGNISVPPDDVLREHLNKLHLGEFPRDCYCYSVGAAEARRPVRMYEAGIADARRPLVDALKRARKMICSEYCSVDHAYHDFIDAALRAAEGDGGTLPERRLQEHAMTPPKEPSE